MKKVINIVSWLVIASPLAYLWYRWNDLPGEVALHFNLKGEPDRYGPKSELWLAIGVLAVMALLIHIFLPLVYKIDPKKSASDNKTRLHRIAFAVVLMLSAVSFFIVDSSVKGGFTLNQKLLFGGLGIFFCILGNYMYNIKPNYFAGFRLPWTLNSEENWRKTHHLGGKLLFAAGLLIVLLSMLVPEQALPAVFITVVMVAALIPVIYSYRLYRQSTNNKTDKP